MSSTKNCTSAGVCVSASIPAMSFISVLLPLCGAPTISACPAAPEKSAQSMSRRCSNGLSTNATGIVSFPLPPQPSGHRPRKASEPSGGSSWSKVGGSSSGGSQIWCAAGPASRESIAAMTVSPVPSETGATSEVVTGISTGARENGSTPSSCPSSRTTVLRGGSSPET